MRNPKSVGVIMPVFNGESWIAAAIRSVLAQTYQDFELIVVDDGSTDNTRSVVAGIGDERIRYVFQPNAGLPGARNTGLRMAGGAYLAFLDADDYWHPEMLEACVSYLLAHPAVDVVRTAYIWVDSHDHPLPAVPFCPPCEENTFSCFLLNAVGVMPTSVWTRPACERVGEFDVTLRTAEDRDFLLRAAAAGVRFGFIDRILFYYRQHGLNKTQRFDQRHQADELKPLDKIFALPEIVERHGHLRGKAYGLTLLNCATYAFTSGLLDLALDDYLRAVECEPELADDISFYYRIACLGLSVGQTPQPDNIDFESGRACLLELAAHISTTNRLSSRQKQNALAHLHKALGLVCYGVLGNSAESRVHFWRSLRHDPVTSSGWIWFLRALVGRERSAFVRSFLRASHQDQVGRPQ